MGMSLEKGIGLRALQSLPKYGFAERCPHLKQTNKPRDEAQAPPQCQARDSPYFVKSKRARKLCLFLRYEGLAIVGEGVLPEEGGGAWVGARLGCSHPALLHLAPGRREARSRSRPASPGMPCHPSSAMGSAAAPSQGTWQGKGGGGSLPAWFHGVRNSLPAPPEAQRSPWQIRLDPYSPGKERGGLLPSGRVSSLCKICTETLCFPNSPSPWAAPTSPQLAQNVRL